MNSIARKAPQLSKTEMVADIIGATAQNHGATESIRVGDLEGKQAIYVDGEIYDLLKDVSGVFRQQLDTKLKHSGLYLEAFTYSIYTVEEQ